MKEIKAIIKFAKKKSKYPKSETTPYNPWAVCNTSTGGKKEAPEEFERCVHHIKDQNRETNLGKKKKKKKRKESSILPPLFKEAVSMNVPVEGKMDKKKAKEQLDEIFDEIKKSYDTNDLRKADILKQMYDRVLMKAFESSDPEYLELANRPRQICPKSVTSGSYFNLTKEADKKEKKDDSFFVKWEKVIKEIPIKKKGKNKNKKKSGTIFSLLKSAQDLGPNGPIGEDNPASDDLGLSGPISDWNQPEEDINSYDYLYVDIPHNLPYATDEDMDNVSKVAKSIESEAKREGLPWEWDGSHDKNNIGFKWTGVGDSTKFDADALEEIAQREISNPNII